MDTTNGTVNGLTNAHTDCASPQTLPIMVAGGGCVGLFLALLLAQSGVLNKVIIIEPEHPDPTSTRAMAHQPPTYPILNRIPGLLPELIRTGSLSSGLCFRTSVANGSGEIAGKRFDNSGEGMKGKGQLLLPQGKFQAVLMKRLVALGSKSEIRLGSRVTSFVQNQSSVTATVQDNNGQEEEIEASYLIGADGAHSTIRKHLNIEFKGETLDAQLVAMDLHFDFHAHGFYDANFIIDPQDYGLIGRISNPEGDQPALWRVSYGVSIGMSEGAIRQEVDRKLSAMLPGGGKDVNGELAYKVQRIAPYKAQQRCVESFVHQNTIVIGDAAHLTNPYAGLGLASGMADASSLSEVLVRILSDAAASKEKLLQAWSEDRRAKFLNVVDKPSRMAYKRVKSDVSTEEKIQELMAGDPLVGALKKGMPVMPPSLETKGEELVGW